MTTPAQGPRWNFRISGAAVDSYIIDRLAEAFRRIEELPGAGVIFTRVDRLAHGWEATGAGESDDPAVHGQVLTTVRDIAAADDAQTGSSEFASPFLTSANFHAAPASGGEEPAGAQGTPGP